jgi:hypothetical protein
MNDKPTTDPAAVHALAEFFRNNPDDDFIFQLYWRAWSLMQQSELPHAAVTFEMMESAFSGFEGGLGHDDISAGYPVKAWREDTVEIPRAWLRVLVEGWRKYKTAPAGSTFGEAFKLEGGKQGASPARERLAHFNRGIRLSNAVMIEYLDERQNGGRGSWERAAGKAAEAIENVSASTFERASKKHRHGTLSTASYLGIASGCTTSRRGAPDPEE